MMNQAEYVELGLACANVCTTLDRAMDGRPLGNLSQSVREAVGELITLVKPKTHICTTLTMFWDAALWRISNGRSSNWANGVQPLDCST